MQWLRESIQLNVVCLWCAVLPVSLTCAGGRVMGPGCVSIRCSSCTPVGQVHHRGALSGLYLSPWWLLNKEEEAERSLRNETFQGAVEGETNQGREFTVFAIWPVFVGQEKINVSPAQLLAGFPFHRRVPERLATVLTVLQGPGLRGVWYLN